MAKKEQRRTDVSRRAYELAETGRYSDYLDIEHVLIMEGYPEAREWLDRRAMRDDLRNICLAAQKRLADAHRT